MRISLVSGSVVETVVTLAAAALMTFAGFEMLAGVTTTSKAAARVSQSAVSPTPRADATRG
jgi:hypothetical protein